MNTINTIDPEEAMREFLSRDNARSSLTGFASYIDPSYVAEPIHELIGHVCDDIVFDRISPEIQNIIVNVPPQFGKCLRGDTKVILANGLIKSIKELNVNSYILTEKGSGIVIAKESQGIKPLVKVTLVSGKVIECTSNHKFKTVNGWTSVSDLIPKYSKLACLSELPIVDKVPLEYGVASLLGYLIGDGSYSTGNLSVTTTEPAVIAHLTDIAKYWKLNVSRYHLYEYSLVYNIDWCIGTNKLKTLVNSILNKGTSYTKTVPDEILNGCKQDILDFLAAYFNCDGTVNNKGANIGSSTIEYYSVSRNVLESIQLLLTKLGIYSHLQAKNGLYLGNVHHSWRLWISGIDIIKFADIVPVIGIKGSALVNLSNELKLLYKHPSYTELDADVFKYFKKSPESYRRKYNIRFKSQLSVSKEKVAKIAKIDASEYLNFLCDSSIIWDRVESIEPIESDECFDIQVSPNGNFILANGVISHNSQLISVDLPPYWFGHRPDEPIILTTYAAELAESKSKSSQKIMDSPEYKILFPETALNPSDRSVPYWSIDAHKGYLLTGGVKGGVTGFGCKLAILDDPYKNWEEAQSETLRKKVEDFLKFVLRTRMWKGAKLFTVMTRWHPDDLTAYILRNQPKKTLVIRVSAIGESQKERDRRNKLVNLPEGLADPLGRAEGESAAPKRFPVDTLIGIKEDVGSLVWEGLYMQSPTTYEGNRVKREWFKYVDFVPKHEEIIIVRYWDKAGSEATGKFTAGTCLIYDLRTDYWYVEDVRQFQYSAGKREKAIKDTADYDNIRFNNTIKTYIEQEPASGGKESAENTVYNLSEYFIGVDLKRQDKLVRFEPFAAKVEAGRVYIKQAPWKEDLLNQLCEFPNGQYMDMADSLSGAFAMIMQIRKKRVAQTSSRVVNMTRSGSEYLDSLYRQMNVIRK